MGKFDWKAGDVTITYRYGMKLRGFSPGAQPMDGFVERLDDPTGRYYDIVAYSRPLTEKELKQYDMEVPK